MEEEIPGSTEQTPAEARGGKYFWYSGLGNVLESSHVYHLVCVCHS